MESYPLSWPPGKPRCVERARSRFDQSLASALRALKYQVMRLGGRKLVVSTNLEVRRDGLLHFERGRPPPDPGAAVYFFLGGGRAMCFACDRWDSVTDNLYAIAKTIEALRGIERWGTGDMVEQAFTGFLALPNPEQPWQVLGLASAYPTRQEVQSAYRKLVNKYHEANGGSHEDMVRINTARDELMKLFETDTR